MNSPAAFSERIANRHQANKFQANKPQADSLRQIMFAPGSGTAFLHRKTAGHFSSSVTIKNDIAVNIRFNLSGFHQTVFGFMGGMGRYVPLSPHINADYEYYLQKNRVRNMYDLYHRLTDYAGKTVSALTTLSKIHTFERTQTITAAETRLLLRRFAEYTGVMYGEIPHPRVLFETSPNRVPVSEPHTHTENRIKETVEADFRVVPRESVEAVGRIGVKAAAEQVYKRLSDDLRRERLKRGY